MPVSWQRLAVMTGRLMCHISTYHPNNQIFVKWSILTIFSFQFSQVFSVGAILDVLFCCMSKKEPHFYKNVTGNEWFHMWKWQFYMWIWHFKKWKAFSHIIENSHIRETHVFTHEWRTLTCDWLFPHVHMLLFIKWFYELKMFPRYPTLPFFLQFGYLIFWAHL